MRPEALLDWNGSALRAPHTARDKRERVRRMFNAIAPTYELINSLFSLGRDASWRREAVRLAAVRPGESVLDVACGTGDMARAFAAAAGPPRGASIGVRVMGCDFARDMLLRAATRAPASRAGICWCEADALRLPFVSESHDVVACAFGVRNFQDLGAGLREMHRVLRPGGRAVILEFTRPARLALRVPYEFYLNRLMPWLATRISRDRTGAYRYLPRSVLSFESPAELSEHLSRAGFARTTSRPLTFGIVRVYVASKE